MLILLPPSEGKTAPRRGNSLDLDRLSFPALTDARREMLDALVRTSAEHPDALRVLGLTVGQAGEVPRNAALHTARTARADKVYSGVLYEALDVSSLDASARRPRHALAGGDLVGVRSGAPGRPDPRLPTRR